MNPLKVFGGSRSALGTVARLVVSMLLLTIGPVNSWIVEDAEAAPAAGTVIGNQASATYTDGTNVQRTATSNVVQTTVAQRAALTLTPNNSLPGVSGATVTFAHTLTNTGNGSDTFNLTGTNQGGDTFDFAPAGTPVAFFADANGDGVADNATTITNTGPLAAGGVFRFVAVVTVPGGQANGATGIIQVQGASTFTPAVTDSKLDTVTVNSNASLSVVKSMSAISGNAGSGPYTVTLTYTNSGVATATAVTLADVIPANMTYVAGSARWSVTGATALTDAVDAAQGTAPNTILYDFGVTVANRVTAVINQVPAGVSGTLTFQVNIAVGAAGTLNNTALYQYVIGAATVPGVGAFLNTNTVGFSVTPPTITAAVAIDDNPLQAGDVTLNDRVESPAVLQGSTVTFNNRVHNNGTASDTFDIAVSGSTFPAGTSFLLFQSDGVTPLTHSAGNGAPDTGPVAAGAVYTVVVRAVLPPSAITAAASSVTITATSVNNPTVSDTVVDELAAINATTVDMTNGTARADSSPAGTANAGNAGTTGFGSHPVGGPAITTNNATPGTTTTFTLFVNNISPGTADTYDLTAWADEATSVPLPAGWTVTFRNTGGTTITNTGVIAAGANVQVNAIVTVPPGASGTRDIFFRVLSPTTTATDKKHDAVTVPAGARAISVVPNNTGQVFPNGTVVYSHTITNTGPVTEGAGGAGSNTTLVLSNSQAGWTTELYWDANGNGIFDPAAAPTPDALVSDLTFLSGGAAGLAPGESATLFVRVVAPASAATGTVNVTTMTATTAGGAGAVPPVVTATDTTTVNSSQVQLIKEQALDATCDGTPDGAFSSGAISGALPGACIRYRITATNVGTTNVTAVNVSDATPPNTVYDDGSRNAASGTCGTGAVDAAAAASVVGGVPPPAPPVTAPACNGAGTVSVTLGTLTPTQALVLTFGIMINP
jgi:uncharacterized repeat protein (TIGR01451 family)